MTDNITPEDAMSRVRKTLTEMQPSTDQQVAAAIGQLGEQNELRTLAHLSNNEMVAMAIGLSWEQYSSSPKTVSFTTALCENLLKMSPARGGRARSQIEGIAKAHAGGGMQQDEGRFRRFAKWVRGGD